MKAIHYLLLSTLPLSGLLSHAAASVHQGVERIPLGGALFQFESRNLEMRDDSGPGSDCEADPACSSVDWGCQCEFEDTSWIDDGNDDGGGTTTTSAAPSLPSSAPSTPAFSCTMM